MAMALLSFDFLLCSPRCTCNFNAGFIEIKRKHVELWRFNFCRHSRVKILIACGREASYHRIALLWDGFDETYHQAYEVRCLPEFCIFFILLTRRFNILEFCMHPKVYFVMLCRCTNVEFTSYGLYEHTFWQCEWQHAGDSISYYDSMQDNRAFVIPACGSCRR